ncbi:MAG: hypothetical protein BAJALOKI2v1_220022 [Promethearchaeota archaeon]|nr:MAG: hypothetical protein BAJALOKI2v1_220022 [Candidatus Lokiarchaeota archaeon]
MNDINNSKNKDNYQGSQNTAKESNVIQSAEEGNINEENESFNDNTIEEETEVFGDSDLDEEKDDSEELEDDLRIFKKNLIEAALYASGEALSVEILSAKLDFSKEEVQELIVELQEIYENRQTSLIIAKIGEKYQMRIKSEYMEIVSQFAEGGGMAEKYLRTLTIIALKQPILKSTLVKLRGSGAYEHVKYLEDNALIDSIKKGRTSELTTTDKFAEMFGLPKNVQEMKKVMVDQGLGLPEEEIENNKEES